MWMSLIVGILSSDLTKQLILIALRKLLEHKTDGVTRDIASEMLDAIAKSKLNPVDDDLVRDAQLALKQG